MLEPMHFIKSTEDAQRKILDDLNAHFAVCVSGKHIGKIISLDDGAVITAAALAQLYAQHNRHFGKKWPPVKTWLVSDDRRKISGDGFEELKALRKELELGK